ncbi:hypothetical protein [Nostoc sp. CALU 1950]|uniref:hypothetical protein n=1 Tax=Nostoc sp. CALU 1950 TaxID=3104321 RepID=UPI003EBD808F
MLNNKTPNSSVVERVGSCIAVFALQLYAVVSGSFKNILAKAKVSQLSNWLCLDDSDRNITGVTVAGDCNTGFYWQFLLVNAVLSKEPQGEN